MDKATDKSSGGHGSSGWQRLDKDGINERPMRRYEGPVHLVRSVPDLASAVRKLETEELLGFDTETRPAFRKGESYLPSILQLAGAREVFVFQLRHLGMPRPLLSILGNPRILKAGVSLDYDIRELRRLAEFTPAGFVDVGNLAKEKGVQNHGLRGLAAVLLGFRISKAAKTSKWDAAVLSEAQMRYAATDAWVGRELYMALKKMP